LIFDLKKPARFIYLLTKPNLNSWLVLGGYVLIVYGMLASVWLFYGFRGLPAPPIVVWLAALFAIASAGYSAFLIAQARGRDFWQSPLLFWHLIVQAIVAGAAMLTLLAALQLVTPFQFLSGRMLYWLGQLLVIALSAGLAMIFGDLLMEHRGEEVARPANLLVRGALWKQFWLVVVGLGTVAPIVLTLWPTASVYPNLAASLLALLGLWTYENLWIKAGQVVPLS
jgi:formate-dependent nitrite reductase membrane component NrfD